MRFLQLFTTFYPVFTPGQLESDKFRTASSKVNPGEIMKSRFWNERTRLMLTLELTLVLPAAALIIASALHLRSIQRDRAVEAAIQRDFSQVLAIAEKQINHKAYDLIDDVRSQFPTNTRVCSTSLDRILASHP